MADEEPIYPPFREQGGWGVGGANTPSPSAEFHGSGPYEGLAQFVGKNFSTRSVESLWKVAETHNRYQKGSESIVEILSKTKDGEMLLKVLESFQKDFEKNKMPVPFDLNAKNSSLHLQDILEILAKLKS